jgi:hypothetical protein
MYCRFGEARPPTREIMLIDITVKVPEERLPDFYSMYGRWLAGADDASRPTEEGLEGRHPWATGDEDLASEAWGKFSATAKALFSMLIDNPGRKFSGVELAEALDIANGKHGVAGVLAWPRRHCAAVGREWPWLWEYMEDENARYWMTDEVADLFRRARERRGN